MPVNRGNGNEPGSGATLRDPCGRRLTYLRLSVTARCDLRCRYCVPGEPAVAAARARLESELSFAQLHELARVAVELGIRKIRITGGEPLARPGLLPFLERLAGLPHLGRLVLTTNGTRLARRAAALRATGVAGVNVSIDSLHPERYTAITGGGELARVLAGIEAALAAGLDVKLNVVVLRGVNEDEIPAFVAFGRDRPLCIRFIEYMPGVGAAGDPTLALSADAIMARLAVSGPLEPLAVATDSGPAQVFTVPNHRGTVGVISPVSGATCAHCNRLRVDASGCARSCLFATDTVDLRPWLLAGDSEGLAAALRRVADRKPPDHGGRVHAHHRIAAMHCVGG